MPTPRRMGPPARKPKADQTNGDGRMYAGGTPNFDERTGTYRTKNPVPSGGAQRRVPPVRRGGASMTEEAKRLAAGGGYITDRMLRRDAAGNVLQNPRVAGGPTGRRTVRKPKPVKRTTSKRTSLY